MNGQPWLIVAIVVVAVLVIVVRMNLVTRSGRSQWRDVWRGSTSHKVFVVVVLAVALGAGLAVGTLGHHH